jgi:hypothetical protein
MQVNIPPEYRFTVDFLKRLLIQTDSMTVNETVDELQHLINWRRDTHVDRDIGLVTQNSINYISTCLNMYYHIVDKDNNAVFILAPTGKIDSNYDLLAVA